jgi:hypothetical protein
MADCRWRRSGRYGGIAVPKLVGPSAMVIPVRTRNTWLRARKWLYHSICRIGRLLRSGPPQFPASVFSPRGVGRLCFSLVIRELVPAVPRKSLCPTHAPYTPVAVRPVIRLPADLSQEKKAALILTTFDTLTTRHRKVCLRSSFGHSPALSQSLELLIRRSPPRLFTAAARTGLRPAPESRSRWACHHLLRSFTIRLSVHLEPLSVPLQHNLLFCIN